MSPAPALLEMFAAASSAWTPASLPSLAAWYDASDSSTITASGGAVSQWNDKSGNSRHVTQATGSKQPTTGTTLNGLGALSFANASDQYLSVGSVTVAQPVTLLVVVKRASTSVGNCQIIGNKTNPEPTLYSSANTWHFYEGTDLGSGTSSGNTNAHQLVALFNGASSQLWLDGSSIKTGTLGTNGRTDIAIGSDGSGSGWDGLIAEVAITGSAITSGDRALWNTYCARWGL